MKQAILAAFLLAFAAATFAQTPCTPAPNLTCTSNLSLYLPGPGYVNWNVPVNVNMQLLDADSSNWAKLNSSNIFTGNLTAPTFIGNLTGNVAGNVTGNVSGTAGGLSGTPSISIQNLAAAGTVTFPSLAGGASYCLHISSLGVVSNTGSECNSGGSYPGAGIVVSTGVGWGASLTAPSSTIVGVSDAQTLSNKAFGGGMTWPIFNQPTTGNAATASALSTTGSNGQFWGVSGGVQGYYTPAGSLPSASSNYQLVLVNTSGVASVLTTQNSQINAVINAGLDSSGLSDVGSAILTIIAGLSSSNPSTIYFPPGTYLINSGVQVPCTSTTCNGLRIIGAGRDATFFKTNCSNGYGWWLNNTTNSGDNFLGPDLEDFTIQDTSGTGACNSLLRLTQISLFNISDVKVRSAQGKNYTTGTVSVPNGSTAVTGSSTTFTSAMVPGIMQINGIPQEVCSFNSSTSLSLCTKWQQTTASTANYSLDYNGIGLMIDGGYSYTQYGTVHNLFAFGNKFGIYAVGVGTCGPQGTSRISFDGKAGWVDGLRIANSTAAWFGRCSDTFDYNMPSNNTAFGVYIDGGHAHTLRPDVEDDGTPTVVTTCNGGVASQACLVGIGLTGDAASNTYGTTLAAPYVYNTGTAIRVDSSSVTNLTIYGLRGASFANTNNYSFSGVTGCPGNGSGVSATIVDYDCVHTQVAVTVN